MNNKSISSPGKVSGIGLDYHSETVCEVFQQEKEIGYEDQEN